ncbi:septal ring lytic transglycosylase RlpA family protein [uncultured Sphingorhabdus sp.]|uniref:septal ring lytic transglycosylase RlpA family protein n=1 Tax=uncultured Sphingorhabdus sp. TaxID=1686106 RepID=UPI00261F1CBC|nr:septal ring lytic transglycosylase RlpA family protein [uncultured Sphingorhabdus sp.]HMS21433.1 septal ring lytic transglycosylase RlpA family protein [Sphingorhabdus sp.]
MQLRKILLATLIAMAPFAAQATADADLGSGHASYYGNELAGRRTASGEMFNPSDFTAAHRTVAFGTRVKVTHLGNGREVIVRVNDRGPWGRGRIIDLSYAAAKELGMHRSGTAQVKLALVRD